MDEAIQLVIEPLAVSGYLSCDRGGVGAIIEGLVFCSALLVEVFGGRALLALGGVVGQH